MSDIILVNDVKDSKKRLRIAALIAGVLLASFAVIGVLIWNLIPKDYDKVTIMNRDEISDLNGNEINNLRSELLTILRDNGIINDDETVDDVVVREGTVVSEVEGYGNGYWKTTTFLIDIASIKQTYSVRMVDSDSSDMVGITAQIYCPKKSESKYPESECIGLYNAGNNYLTYSLPYRFTMPTGEKVLVKKIDVSKNGFERLRTVQVYLYSCDEKNPPVAETEAAVREWVKSLNDPISENYVYNIRTGYCEGDAI